MAGHNVHTIVMMRAAAAARVGQTVGQEEFTGIRIEGTGPDRKVNGGGTGHK